MKIETQALIYLFRLYNSMLELFVSTGLALQFDEENSRLMKELVVHFSSDLSTNP